MWLLNDKPAREDYCPTFAHEDINSAVMILKQQTAPTGLWLPWYDLPGS